MPFPRTLEPFLRHLPEGSPFAPFKTLTEAAAAQTTVLHDSARGVIMLPHTAMAAGMQSGLASRFKPSDLLFATTCQDCGPVLFFFPSEGAPFEFRNGRFHAMGSTGPWRKLPEGMSRLVEVTRDDPVMRHLMGESQRPEPSFPIDGFRQALAAAAQAGTDRAAALALLADKPTVYGALAQTLRADPTFELDAVKANPRVYRALSEAGRRTPLHIVTAARRDPRVLAFARPEDLTPGVQRAIIEAIDDRTALDAAFLFPAAWGRRSCLESAVALRTAVADLADRNAAPAGGSGGGRPSPQ